MKLQYMCLDSALDLWPPGHFALGSFASRIGCSEMECSALGFFCVRRKPRFPDSINSVNLTTICFKERSFFSSRILKKENLSPITSYD